MEEDKKIVGGWWVWILTLIVLSAIVLGTLNALGLIGKTYVQRKVFEQSYQKQEADKTAMSSYQAELQILHRRLNSTGITEAQRSEIQAQIDGITVLLSTKKD